MRASLAVVFALFLVLASTTNASAAPPRDAQPPTTPTNLRVTATGQTGITLRWDPSTDDRQVKFYGAWAPGLPVAYVDHPSTTATFANLHPGTTYAFRVQAWDGTNWSSPSTILNATTSPDIVAPTAPTGLAPGTTVHGSPVDNLTASTVLLKWTNATDDFGPLRYQVLVDGEVDADTYDTRPAGSPVTTQSVVWVRRLTPGTTYTVTVRAIDSGGNISVPSNAITVTTDPSADTTAPSTPTLLSAFGGGTGVCPEELWLRWTAATDNDPALDYEVRVNGVINEVVPVGTQTITYTEVNGPNTVTVAAVDRAGNASAPSNAITENVNWGTGCTP